MADFEIIIEKEKEKDLGGRPRVHDRQQIAKELIEWALLDTSTNLNGFCATRIPMISPCKITQWADEDNEDGKQFRKAYECAKACIGMRRELMLSNGSLHSKAYDLNYKVYDHFAKKEWKESIKFESDIKKDDDQNLKLTQVEQFNNAIAQFKSALLSDRNIDDNNISNDK